MLLKFYGPGMSRNRPDVGNIFMQCLHLLRRYFVPLPWRFLTQPELQQGSDRLNCNQKHFLMLYAIKINCIYINEQVASIFSCNLRSDSELERHFGPAFSVTPARRILFFGSLKFRASGPKFCTGSLICTSSKFLFVHLVTMSAMPPVDNYITLCIFYWKTVTGPRYYNGRGISRPNVEMNCNDIFMRQIFWSTWNAKVIAQSQRPNGKKWRIVGGRCWDKKISLSWSLNRLQFSLYQQAGGTRSKYNYWRCKGLTEQ